MFGIFDKIQNFFTEKLFNTYGKSLVRKVLMGVSGIIVAKAPVLQPVADAITGNLDQFSAGIVAAVLSGLAVISSYADKSAEAKEKEELVAAVAKKATTKKKVAKK